MYRRGMPDKPKKCWGKNVILTPVNIQKKCPFNIALSSVKPVNRGNQCIKPAIAEKTAPILNT